MSLSLNTTEAARILGLPAPSAPLAIDRITTDSRDAGPGSMFVAIPGDRFDGHDFIPTAIEKGAVAIVSERPGSHPTGAFFQVPSTMNAIRALARAQRKKFEIPLIGVVGAVGKTTTKELIASVLAGRYGSIVKTEGSQNGFLGIPLTLFGLNASTEVGVIEIGIDEIGAMEQHMELVEPTHVILTRTGPEHLHQLKTIEIAAEEELKAFDHALARKVPMAIHLGDSFVSEWYRKNRETLKSTPHFTYSMNPADGADFTGVYDAKEARLTVRRSSSEKDEAMEFACPLPGEHHAENLLAAVVVSRFFGLDSSEIARGISTFKTATGRTELHSLANGISVIGDHYNSNPTSLRAALKLLRASGATDATGALGGLHAVLGDMLELGDNEERFHREAADSVLEFGVKDVWLYGPRMKWLLDELTKRGHTGARHFETHDELVRALLPALRPGARVLVKGSRGMKMEMVLRALIAGGTSS